MKRIVYYGIFLTPLIAFLSISPINFRSSNEHRGFREDWSKGLLSTHWLAFRRVWGYNNNGCVPELISIEEDIVDGVKKNVVVLTCQGNLSKSKIFGLKPVENGFENSGHPEKVGACITTLNHFASGNYEVKMKIGLTNDNPPKAPIGLSPFIMLFHYEKHFAHPSDNDGSELNEMDPQYQPRFKEMREDGLYFSTVNAEVDAPELGLNGNFSIGLYNTYLNTSRTGNQQQKIPLPIDILDGQYHTFRFERHTKLIPTNLRDDQVRPQGAYYYAFDSVDSSLQGFPVVKKADCKWYVYAGASLTYYIDGHKIGESKQNISPVSARLAIGGWFPEWAGTPNWDESKIYISHVIITPYHNEGDILFEPEMFPSWGLSPLPYRLCNQRNVPEKRINSESKEP